MDPELVRKIQGLGQRIERLEGALPEIGAQPVFLSAPLTNATFNGDSFSDVGANTKIENTSWSSTIPTNAKALLIYGYVRDSGSAGTAGLFFALYPAVGSTVAAVSFAPSGRDNDDPDPASATVPCTDGDIWYQCNASGANTLDVWLYCWGYWL